MVPPVAVGDENQGIDFVAPTGGAGSRPAQVVFLGRDRGERARLPRGERHGGGGRCLVVKPGDRSPGGDRIDSPDTLQSVVSRTGGVEHAGPDVGMAAHDPLAVGNGDQLRLVRRLGHEIINSQLVGSAAVAIGDPVLAGEGPGEDVAAERLAQPAGAIALQVEVVVAGGTIGFAIGGAVGLEALRGVDEGPAEIGVGRAVGQVGVDIDVDRVIAELVGLDVSGIQELLVEGELDAGVGAEALLEIGVVGFPERPLAPVNPLQRLVVEIEDRRIGELEIAPEIEERGLGGDGRALEEVLGVVQPAHPVVGVGGAGGVEAHAVVGHLEAHDGGIEAGEAELGDVRILHDQRHAAGGLADHVAVDAEGGRERLDVGIGWRSAEVAADARGRVVNGLAERPPPRELVGRRGVVGLARKLLRMLRAGPQRPRFPRTPRRGGKGALVAHVGGLDLVFFLAVKRRDAQRQPVFDEHLVVVEHNAAGVVLAVLSLHLGLGPVGHRADEAGVDDAGRAAQAEEHGVRTAINFHAIRVVAVHRQA